MIVTDLDGTLLNENQKVSEESKEYLKKLKDMGYIIVIATARIYASALKATDGADFANYLITDTGAFTYDMSNLKPINKNIVDKKVVKKLFDYYSDDFHHMCVCNKDNIYRYYGEKIENSDIKKISKDKEFILNNCPDISHISIFMKDKENVMKLYYILIEDIKEVDTLIMENSFSNKKWIEILSKNVSKFKAIDNLANMINIDSKDIICFGDGLNDIDMLKNFNGVAMKNALIGVKKVSNDVTTYDNNHDGVINYLKEHLDVK